MVSREKVEIGFYRSKRHMAREKEQVCLLMLSPLLRCLLGAGKNHFGEVVYCVWRLQTLRATNLRGRYSLPRVGCSSCAQFFSPLKRRSPGGMWLSLTRPPFPFACGDPFFSPRKMCMSRTQTGSLRWRRVLTTEGVVCVRSPAT